MLLTISTTHQPATDLGFLLHKNPARSCQSLDLAFGQAHMFYPEVGDTRCTFALLLDLNPVELVRGGEKGGGGLLDQYVNDRPYAASSFLSVAIARCLRTALGGRCDQLPDLAGQAIPLEAMLTPLPVRGEPELIAVTAAEMGILVMGTLHTNGAAPTVDRIVNAFPADKQPHVRAMLSTSLRGVVSQQLVPKAGKPGRVAAHEILVNTPAVANLIRQGKLDQLENAMQSGASFGMRLMDSAISELLDKAVISGKSAYQKAINKAKFESVKDNG